MFFGLHVKYPLFLSDFNQTLYFSTDFPKILHIKFHENAPSGSPGVPCGRTDMMQLTVVFRQFANAPINRAKESHELK